jgi:MFS family permease
VLGQLFFPRGAADAQSLAAVATFGIAFFARPIGSFIFGHFGDHLRPFRRPARAQVDACRVAAVDGPLHHADRGAPRLCQCGRHGPVLLCVLRLGRGIGLGGERGGAALLATENAPHHRRAWFGMFPQLEPPLGFLMSNGLFLLLFLLLTHEQFAARGWRITFLASGILVVVGLYVRGRLSETPAFARLAARGGQVRVPFGVLLPDHGSHLVLGSLAMVVCYAIFYTTTVFALDCTLD